MRPAQRSSKPDVAAQGEGPASQADDFVDQMLSTMSSAWADLGAGGNKSPWELAAGAEDATVQAAFGDESATPSVFFAPVPLAAVPSHAVRLAHTTISTPPKKRKATRGREHGGGCYPPLLPSALPAAAARFHLLRRAAAPPRLGPVAMWYARPTNPTSPAI
jgi:hypothetical protein